MATTRAAQLAREYVRLGGGRLAKIDDNHVTTRQWRHETFDAEVFWRKNIEPLDGERKREVITLLPSINQT